MSMNNNSIDLCNLESTLFLWEHTVWHGNGLNVHRTDLTFVQFCNILVLLNSQIK